MRTKDEEICKTLVGCFTKVGPKPLILLVCTAEVVGPPGGNIPSSFNDLACKTANKRPLKPLGFFQNCKTFEPGFRTVMEVPYDGNCAVSF